MTPTARITAFVLAAGRGERMRPLTDTMPKPLLRVRGKPLIVWHLEALARAGVRDVVINTGWLGEQIPAALGDGSRHGVSIRYSMEGVDHGGALETAGGMKKALPLLGDVFWYVAGDIHAPEFRFADDESARFAAGSAYGRLWMVPNPPQSTGGDFGIDADGLIVPGRDGERRTWSAIGLFRRSFVESLMTDFEAGSKAKLRPYLDRAIAERRLEGEAYDGPWADVGTPERLRALG